MMMMIIIIIVIIIVSKNYIVIQGIESVPVPLKLDKLWQCDHDVVVQ